MSSFDQRGGARGSGSRSGGQIKIGSINISGVEAGVADRLGPAIKAALLDAAKAGRLSPVNRNSLRLDLPHGATEREITSAVIRALGRR